MKKIITVILGALILLSCTIASAEQSVNVQIASFKTEINYENIDNRYIEYPLIVYKDITYFPMTYDLCQSLGLMTGYSEEEGLYITSQYTDIQGEGEKKPYGGSAVNNYGQYYKATVTDYPIYLNGVRIYNDKEEYPLLNFRQITYFPMTWRFAYEQMGFDINWSQEDSAFTIKQGNYGSSLYPTRPVSNGVEFAEHIDVYEPKYDENGNVSGAILLYDYYKGYFFDIVNKTISDKGQIDEADTKATMYDTPAPTPSEEIPTEIKDNSVYAGGKLLFSSEADEKITYSTAVRTDIGNNTSLIKLYNQVGESPPPYTQMTDYVLEEKNGEIKTLDIDKKYIIKGIYDMGDKVYIATSGYRAAGSARWSNSFSDVFIYTKSDGSLKSMVKENSDRFNSIQFLGYTDGKLYVKAMWYNSDKKWANTGGGIPTFSTVNSGFYSVDVTNDNLTKLYPYIKGESFVFPDGNLYAIAKYSIRPILVNLCTGEMYKFE